MDPRLARRNAHAQRPRLAIVLKRGREIGALQRSVELVGVDLTDVATDIPAGLPVVGHVEGDIAVLANGAQHFEPGELDGLRLIVARLLGRQVDDDRTLLFFFQFDENDLARGFGRFCCVRELGGSSVIRYFGSWLPAAADRGSAWRREEAGRGIDRRRRRNCERSSGRRYERRGHRS